MATTIGTIKNFYGGLLVMKEEGKFYWGIGDWNKTEWEEITEELYNSLISFDEKPLKQQ